MEPYTIGTKIRKKDFGEVFEIVDANENTDNRDPSLGTYNYTVDPPVPNGIYHGQIGSEPDQAYELVEEGEDDSSGSSTSGPLTAEL